MDEVKVARTFRAKLEPAIGQQTEVTIRELHTFRRVDTRGGSSRHHIATEFKTTEGYHVNPEDDGTYSIVDLGEAKAVEIKD